MSGPFPESVYLIVIILACLACTRHGQRVQIDLLDRGAWHEKQADFDDVVKVLRSQALTQLQALNALRRVLLTHPIRRTRCPGTTKILISNRHNNQQCTKNAIRSSPKGPVMKLMRHFDSDVLRVLSDAQSEARSLGASSVNTNHMLLAATLQNDDVRNALEGIGITEQKLRAHMNDPLRLKMRQWEEQMSASSAKAGPLPFDKDVKFVLTETHRRECTGNGPYFQISWSKVVLTMLETNQASIIDDFRIDPTDPNKVGNARGSSRREVVTSSREDEENKKRKLAQFSEELTQLEREGKLWS